MPYLDELLLLFYVQTAADRKEADLMAKKMEMYQYKMRIGARSHQG